MARQALPRLRQGFRSKVPGGAGIPAESDGLPEQPGLQRLHKPAQCLRVSWSRLAQERGCVRRFDAVGGDEHLFINRRLEQKGSEFFRIGWARLASRTNRRATIGGVQ